jgi:hypothetical protein
MTEKKVGYPRKVRVAAFKKQEFGEPVLYKRLGQ